MKRKIIAIVISVVIVAGTGTAVGVVVKQNNDAKTEELVSVAVSEALATTETTTKNSTSESATTESTTTESTTASAAAKPSAKATTTEAKTVLKTEKKQPATIVENTDAQNNKIKHSTTANAQDNTRVKTPLGYVYKSDSNKQKDKIGYYWTTDYMINPNKNDDIYYECYIDENNNLFYFDNNGDRIYYKP